MELFTTDDGKYRIETLSAVTVPGALRVRFCSLFFLLKISRRDKASRNSKITVIDAVLQQGNAIIHLGFALSMDGRNTAGVERRVIKEAFCQDETVSIGTEINKNEAAAEELLELCADTALDGVSLVAVHVESENVVSVAFNKLQVATGVSSEKPFFEIFAAERCKQPSAKGLIKFMADIDAECNFFEKFNLECSLEIMFLATLREHRYHKLGYLLCKLSVELTKTLQNGPVATITVKDLGPKYAFMPERKAVNKVPQFCQAIWTGEPTQKIGKVLGFKVYARVPFTEFSYNGKTYSERVGKDVWCEGAAIML